MKTWPDVVLEVWPSVQPFVPYGCGLILLYALTRILDRSVRSTISETFQEIVGAMKGENSARTLNVLGGILVFVTIAILYSGGLAHIALPAHESPTNFALGVFAFVIFTLAGYFILCVSATNNTD